MEQLPAIITKARARLLVRAPFIGSIALGLAWVNAPDLFWLFHFEIEFEF